MRRALVLAALLLPVASCEQMSVSPQDTLQHAVRVFCALNDAQLAGLTPEQQHAGVVLCRLFGYGFGTPQPLADPAVR